MMSDHVTVAVDAEVGAAMEPVVILGESPQLADDRGLAIPPGPTVDLEMDGGRP